MKNVSEEYIVALYESAIVNSSISGIIVTTTGVTYDLTDADIIPGSLNKNNKCVNGSSFELGTVYQGELNVTLKKTMDRYMLLGGSISFTEHRVFTDGTCEDVDIGIYYITSVDRSKQLITIKAADSMSKLDVDIVDDVSGTPYELLAAISDKCGVGLAQTEEEITALPNGQQMFYVYADTTETYRDLAAYLGMMTGTFATITTDDKLKLCAYATEDCMIIPANKRTSGSTVISDYVTYYKGIKARFIATENYASYEYADETIADGLVLDLGDIPIVRGQSETKYAVLQTLFEVIKQIRYIPTEFTLVTSDAALELGDRIGIGGEDVSTYITSYDWTYHGSERLKGVGDNPRLKSSGDKTQKQLAALEEQISAKDVIVHSYTNVSEYTINSKSKEIISINYAATASAHPVFIATIPFNVDLDGYAVFEYYLDGVLMTDDTLRQYVARGEHFVTLSNNLSMAANTRATLSVKAYTESFESDIRQQAAKILSFEDYIETGVYNSQAPDTTVPQATIAKGTIRAVLYAQGLASTETWDGTINVAEYITAMDLQGMDMAGFAADVLLQDVTGSGSSAAEIFTALDLWTLPIIAVDTTVILDEVVEQYLFNTSHAAVYAYDTDYVEVEDVYRLKTAYAVSSTEQEIDTGLLSVVKIDTEQFASVQEISIETGVM